MRSEFLDDRRIFDHASRSVFTRPEDRFDQTPLSRAQNAAVLDAASKMEDIGDAQRTLSSDASHAQSQLASELGSFGAQEAIKLAALHHRGVRTREELITAVQRLKRASSIFAATSTAAASRWVTIADELSKFAEIWDAGVMTEEEFQSRTQNRNLAGG